MSLHRNYLFVSERLGFRNWTRSDISSMAEVSANPIVMEFFPSTQSLEYTRDFIERMTRQFEEFGYCYFAVERLLDGQFIGFLGLSRATFDSDFTPCVDIGWRFSPEFWNNGYATEGAKRCLVYAFETLGIEEVFSIASVVNVKSELIMKKIGMEKQKEFKHPLLKDYPRIEDCVLYRVSRDNIK